MNCNLSYNTIIIMIIIIYYYKYNIRYVHHAKYNEFAITLKKKLL